MIEPAAQAIKILSLRQLSWLWLLNHIKWILKENAHQTAI